MLSLTVCPEPGCAAPAEIVDRCALGSTDGPIEHLRIRCVRRHWFFLPAYLLADAAAAAHRPQAPTRGAPAADPDRGPRPANPARRGSPG